MFYQRIMVVVLKHSALEPDSINSHIYFYAHMTSKIYLLQYAFLRLSFSTPRKYFQKLEVFPILHETKNRPQCIRAVAR